MAACNSANSHIKDTVNSSEESNSDSDIEDDIDRPAWLDDFLFENFSNTVGDSILKILQHFFENIRTKKSLGSGFPSSSLKNLISILKYITGP